MVLATDNAMHTEHLSSFKERVAQQDKGEELDFQSFDDKLILLQIALHSADVSNPAKDMEVYMKWTNRVMSEFYDQVRGGRAGWIRGVGNVKAAVGTRGGRMSQKQPPTPDGGGGAGQAAPRVSRVVGTALAILAVCCV